MTKSAVREKERASEVQTLLRALSEWSEHLEREEEGRAAAATAASTEPDSIPSAAATALRHPHEEQPSQETSSRRARYHFQWPAIPPLTLRVIPFFWTFFYFLLCASFFSRAPVRPCDPASRRFFSFLVSFFLLFVLFWSRSIQCDSDARRRFDFRCFSPSVVNNFCSAASHCPARSPPSAFLPRVLRRAPARFRVYFYIVFAIVRLGRLFRRCLSARLLTPEIESSPRAFSPV